MIGTSHGLTPFTTQQVAERTGCCPRRASAKLQALVERLVTVALAEPQRWAQSARPDRAARAYTEHVITAGALAAADPATFRRWVQQLVEAECSAG